MNFDPQHPWYHGSPLALSSLCAGSAITQKQELARIFSHKPTLVSAADDGQIKHNGTTPGFLYVITDEIQPQDVIPHPQTTMNAGDEWLTIRELHLQLINVTNPIPAELLTEADYKTLQNRLSKQV